MLLKKFANRTDDSRRKAVFVCIAVTVVILTAIFVTVMLLRARLPELVVAADGLSAKTPAEAQTELRRQADSFAKIKAAHTDCVFVWCGTDKLYLVRTDKITPIDRDENDNFERVRIYNANGLTVRGYIVDPCKESVELGRIKLVDSKKAKADNVAMTVRIGLREGEIDYTDAVYLWEKGSKEVIVLKSSAVTAKPGKTVSYVDDGEVRHECIVLDTKLK